jgi:hypothetical protein
MDTVTEALDFVTVIFLGVDLHALLLTPLVQAIALVLVFAILSKDSVYVLLPIITLIAVPEYVNITAVVMVFVIPVLVIVSVIKTTEE